MQYRLRGARRPRQLRVFRLVAALVLAAIIVTGIVLVRQSRRSNLEPASQPVAKTVSKPTGEGVVSNILFVGDVFWGRAVQTRSAATGQPYAYPTSGLNRSAWDKYNAHIANFECPITDKDVPRSQQVSILRFNCRPEYLPNLAKWFTAGGQANNHTMNNGGQWGVEQTRTNLQKAGIQYFGNYDMTKLGDICEVITVPAETAQTHKSVSLPIAMCGYMQVVDVAPTDAQLAVMRQYAKVMPVIAFPHMGVEYRTTAEPEKVSAYHRMIDNGADAVIGAHPHVIQNSEVYNGRLIAYSLGNFVFDQQILGRDTTLGLGVGIKLTISDTKAAKVYEQVAPTCKTYKDSCLAELQAKLTKRPTISVSYSYQCYDESPAMHDVPTAANLANCSAATLGKLTNLSTTW